MEGIATDYYEYESLVIWIKHAWFRRLVVNNQYAHKGLFYIEDTDTRIKSVIYAIFIYILMYYFMYICTVYIYFYVKVIKVFNINKF